MKSITIICLAAILFIIGCRKNDDDKFSGKLIRVQYSFNATALENYDYIDSIYYRPDGNILKVVQRSNGTGVVTGISELGYTKQGVLSTLSQTGSGFNFDYQFFYGASGRMDSFHLIFKEQDNAMSTARLTYDTNNRISNVVITDPTSEYPVYTNANYYRNDNGDVLYTTNVKDTGMVRETKTIYTTEHSVVRSLVNTQYCLVTALRYNPYFLRPFANRLWADQYLNPNQFIVSAYTENTATGGMSYYAANFSYYSSSRVKTINIMEGAAARMIFAFEYEH